MCGHGSCGATASGGPVGVCKKIDEAASAGAVGRDKQLSGMAKLAGSGARIIRRVETGLLQTFHLSDTAFVNGDLHRSKANRRDFLADDFQPGFDGFVINDSGAHVSCGVWNSFDVLTPILSNNTWQVGIKEK
jgi:hypothetical protein